MSMEKCNICGKECKQYEPCWDCVAEGFCEITTMIDESIKAMIKGFERVGEQIKQLQKDSTDN